MQIKTTMRYHLTPVRIGIINKATNNKHQKACGEKGTSCIFGGNVSWYNHYGEQYGGTLEIYTYDPVVPLLGIYPDKTFLKKDTCTHMFIAALITIAKTWKQAKCPLRDDWIRKMWYTYTMECYSAIKRTK